MLLGDSVTYKNSASKVLDAIFKTTFKDLRDIFYFGHTNLLGNALIYFFCIRDFLSNFTDCRYYILPICATIVIKRSQLCSCDHPMIGKRKSLRAIFVYQRVAYF